MSNGTDILTAKRKQMDYDILKATAEYIVNTINNSTVGYTDFSILPDMIREYRKLRKELNQ